MTGEEYSHDLEKSIHATLNDLAALLTPDDNGEGDSLRDYADDGTMEFGNITVHFDDSFVLLFVRPNESNDTDTDGSVYKVTTEGSPTIGLIIKQDGQNQDGADGVVEVPLATDVGTLYFLQNIKNEVVTELARLSGQSPDTLNGW